MEGYDTSNVGIESIKESRLASIGTSTQISRDEIAASIRNILYYIGDNPEREGLKETPDRMIRSWSELFAGYLQNPEDILSKCFEDGACDEMVLLKGIEGFSICEHHFLPFSFTANVAYIPNGKVVGISKLARLVECYGRRLQIQENMTKQIADAIMQYLNPKGAMVTIEGKHLCMCARGVNKQRSTMVTSAIRGVFGVPEVRQEFLMLVKE